MTHAQHVGMARVALECLADRSCSDEVKAHAVETLRRALDAYARLAESNIRRNRRRLVRRRRQQEE